MEVPEPSPPSPFGPRRRKVDYAALNSPLMRIPNMSVAAARGLMDCGIEYVDDLRGRCPEALFEDWAAKQAQPNEALRAYFRMATFYAEQPDADAEAFQPWKWQS